MPEIVSSARFSVEIMGITTADTPFFYVSPLVSESIAFETRTGAAAQTTTTPGRLNSADLTLRRQYDGNDALYLWRRNIERGIIDRRSGTLRILDTDHQTIVAEFNFFDAWPRRWSLGPWDAEKDAPLVEEVVLSLRAIERASA